MSPLLEIGLSNAVMAAAMAVVVFALTRFIRRPALVHTLWLLVLLKLVTPPLVYVPIPWLEENAAAPPPTADLRPGLALTGPIASPDAMEGVWVEGVPLISAELPELVGPPEPPRAIDPPVPPAAPVVSEVSWPLLIGACWLGGSVLWLAWAAWRIARFRKLLRSARPASAKLQAQAAEIAGKLGVHRCPGVALVRAAVSPMLWALGRGARLLLPASLLDRLDTEQRATLLAHELAHWRRRDHWVRVLELLVLALYWWNPVVWWARREMHEAEEQCCDAWVVWALPESGRAYATALVQTVAYLSHLPPAVPLGASGIGEVRHLRRRLTMILRKSTARNLSWLGIGCALVLGIVLLPVAPISAQVPTKQAQAEKDLAEAQKKLQAELERVQADLKRIHAEKEKGAEVDAKVKEAIQAAQAQLEKAKAQMAAAQAQFELAKAALEKLQGKTGEKTDADWKVRAGHRVIETKTPDGKVILHLDTADGKKLIEAKTTPEGKIIYGLTTKPADPKLVPPGAAYEPVTKDGKTFFMLRHPDTTGAKPTDGKSVEGRLDALEKKLNDLIKAVEGLQKAKPTGAAPAKTEILPGLYGYRVSSRTAPAAEPPTFGGRVDALEKKLDELLKAVDALKKARSAAPATPARVPLEPVIRHRIDLKKIDKPEELEVELHLKDLGVNVDKVIRDLKVDPPAPAKSAK